MRTSAAHINVGVIDHFIVRDGDRRFAERGIL
jgi:hypothetical protein